MSSSNHLLEGWKLSNITEMYQLFEEHINKLLAGLVALLLTAAATFFRKLPQYIVEKRQRRNFEDVVNLDIILDDLVEETGAVYGHIIKYHNGNKELKPGAEWRMTVTWESLGKPCLDCEHKCVFGKTNKRKRLQQDWDNVPVSSNWFRIVSKAYLNPNQPHITYITDEDLSDIEVEVWKQAGIHSFMEILIKVKDRKFFTLGLSFCENHSIPFTAVSIIAASRKLYRLL